MRRRGFSHRRPRPMRTPPTPTSTSCVPTRWRIARSSAVDGANSGAPDSPPDCCASRLFSDAGRAMVVLLTIRPSMPLASDTAAMSSARRRIDIGRDLEQQRHAQTHLRARLRQQRKEMFELASVLQPAQARRVGRGDIDGDVGGERRELRERIAIIGAAVRAVLVGADIDADDRRRVRACKALGHRLHALDC